MQPAGGGKWVKNNDNLRNHVHVLINCQYLLLSSAVALNYRGHLLIIYDKKTSSLLLGNRFMQEKVFAKKGAGLIRRKALTFTDTFGGSSGWWQQAI
jgi:hypothetical protein